MTGVIRITTIADDSCMANVVQINSNCTSSPWLFKKVDNAIHWISHFSVSGESAYVSLILIQWTVIYPGDSVIQRLMNWAW